MKGLIEEGEETIEENEEEDELAADLALIGTAQKVEHYEISGYGTARCLARRSLPLHSPRSSSPSSNQPLDSYAGFGLSFYP